MSSRNGCFRDCRERRDIRSLEARRAYCMNDEDREELGGSVNKVKKQIKGRYNTVW